VWSSALLGEIFNGQRTQTTTAVPGAYTRPHVDRSNDIQRLPVKPLHITRGSETHQTSSFNDYDNGMPELGGAGGKSTVLHTYGQSLPSSIHTISSPTMCPNYHRQRHNRASEGEKGRPTHPLSMMNRTAIWAATSRFPVVPVAISMFRGVNGDLPTRLHTHPSAAYPTIPETLSILTFIMYDAGEKNWT